MYYWSNFEFVSIISNDKSMSQACYIPHAIQNEENCPLLLKFHNLQILPL